MLSMTQNCLDRKNVSIVDEAGAVHFEETFESKLHIKSPKFARSSISTILMHKYDINTNKNSREGRDSRVDTMYDRQPSPPVDINFDQDINQNVALLAKKTVPALELKKIAAL